MILWLLGCGTQNTGPIELSIDSAGIHEGSGPSLPETTLIALLEGRSTRVHVDRRLLVQDVMEPLTRIQRAAKSTTLEDGGPPPGNHVAYDGPSQTGASACWYPVISVPEGALEVFPKEGLNQLHAFKKATRIEAASGCQLTPKTWSAVRASLPNRCDRDVLAVQPEQTWGELHPWLSPHTDVLVVPLEKVTGGLYQRPSNDCSSALPLGELKPAAWADLKR